ncbi:MAG: hypothetical protein ACLSVD_19245 [Eggerthellaceae bacterium]
MPGEPEGEITLRSNIEEVSGAQGRAGRAFEKPAWSSTTRASRIWPMRLR